MNTEQVLHQQDTTENQASPEYALQEFTKTCADKTRGYYTPLLSPTDNAINPDIGTGNFVIIDKQKGILTNEHVAKIFGIKQSPWITIPNPDDPWQVVQLSYDLIVKLPAKESSYNDVDIAFIRLTEPSCKIANQIGKQFWNLDKSTSDWREFLKNASTPSLWLIHGTVAYGKHLADDKDIKGRKFVNFPNAGPYIVKPNLDNIDISECHYPEINKKFRVDNITCPIATKKAIPKTFNGMSGGFLWGIKSNINAGTIEKMLPIGLATLNPTPEKLICRGPITIYESFYPFCKEQLLTNKKT